MVHWRGRADGGVRRLRGKDGDGVLLATVEREGEATLRLSHLLAAGPTYEGEWLMRWMKAAGAASMAEVARFRRG